MTFPERERPYPLFSELLTRSFLASVLFCSLVAGTPVSYRDYHVFQIDAKSSRDIDKIKALRSAYPTNHLWPSTSRSSDGATFVNAVYAKKYAKKVLAALKRQKLDHAILTTDLQGRFDAADRVRPYRKTRRQRGGAPCKCCNETILTDFFRYDDIVRWMEALVKCHAGDDLGVKMFEFGKTFEGRMLKGIEIGAPKVEGEKKPSVWLHANEHAREWIAGASAIYLIDRLLNDPANKPLVENLHWYIVPIANPDGYEFTRFDRMWRKNRNPTYGMTHNGSCTAKDCKELACVGVDLNRNWDSKWSSHVDTSQDPCEYQIYDGPYPFSEAESLGASEFIKAKLKEFKIFFSLHSYGQLWLVPFSYTKELAPDHVDLMEVAKKGSEAIKAVHGSEWKYGISPEILYAVSGSGMDWAKLAGVRYSYTLELRPKDEKEDGLGFVPNKTEIIPSGEEIFAGIVSVAHHVIGLGKHGGLDTTKDSKDNLS